MLAHAAVPSMGVLTWAVLVGALAANLGLAPTSAQAGLRWAMRRLLRAGVVLLGFSLSLGSVLALGLPMILLVVSSLVSTLVFTTWLGQRLGVSGPRSLLIATGFSICGASAIAAMEENAEGSEDDVAAAITMVTLCGTIAMILLPALQGPLGLSDLQLGAWSGAAVHEVGQVVGAAGAAGSAALAVAVVVKLTRVLCLAPAVAVVSMLRRRRVRQEGDGFTHRLPPLVPAFIAGFVACCLLRSTGLVPGVLLEAASQAQVLTLGTALFAMGTGVHLRTVVQTSGRALVLSLIATMAISTITLAGVVSLI